MSSGMVDRGRGDSASTVLLNASAGIMAWCAAAAYAESQELRDFGVFP